MGLVRSSWVGLAAVHDQGSGLFWVLLWENFEFPTFPFLRKPIRKSFSKGFKAPLSLVLL